MNNPFDHAHIQEEKAEREARRLRLRTNLLIFLFCIVMGGFGVVLYDAQIVHGDDYAADAIVRDIQRENVDSVRGELLDRYGRMLVTNEVSYDVTLDYVAMGSGRNEILNKLLDICAEEGVSWSSDLPISEGAPWDYTSNSPFFFWNENADGKKETRPTYLGRLAIKCGWIENAVRDDLTAAELLTKMCATFGLVEEDEVPSQRDRELAGVLYELYLRRYEVDNSEYLFARGVDITFISKVKENALAGIIINTATSRKYETHSAPHVLGYTGAIDRDTLEYYQELGYPMNATVGKAGVELAFEEKLHGTSGTRRIEKDGSGNTISQEWSKEPEPGDNVVLTLDIALQATVEDLLAQFSAKQEEPVHMAAAVVDMSGGVLALASHPTFDLTTFWDNYAELANDTENRPLLNRATQGTYAPGSTFKMLTAVAALSTGEITPRDTVECTGVYRFYPPPDQPACWIWNSVRGTHGLENVTHAITDSCNIFFYDVGRRIGIKTIREYASKFGLGEYTGIEISEVKGMVSGPETSEYFSQPWYDGLTMFASIGQDNNMFTPLQLANYVATLVNGGNHYQCHLLKECKSSDYSQVTEICQPELRDTIDIDPSHLAAIKQGMYDLSKTASMARYFDPLPVEVGCKTGTAEVASKTANAVFVCFAPYDDPQVALCLVAEQGASGGNLAEIAAGILAQYFSTDSSLSTMAGENILLR